MKIQRTERVKSLTGAGEDGGRATLGKKENFNMAARQRAWRDSEETAGLGDVMRDVALLCSGQPPSQEMRCSRCKTLFSKTGKNVFMLIACRTNGLEILVK